MKDNILIVVLAILVIFLGGTSLMFGIGRAISTNIAPLTTQIAEIKSLDREIQQKLNSRGNTNSSDFQIAILNQRVAALEAKLGINSWAANGGPQFHGQQRPARPQEDFNRVYSINPGASAILGKPNAPVTIVEFSDFQCPFCERFHPVLREVLKAYPDKVRFIIKNFPLPFHPNARPAAKLALSAGLQGKYYEMVDLLMQNGGAVDDIKVKGYAKTLSLNFNKLMDDYKNKDAQWEKIIKDDMELADRVNVHGTPTFFINGRKTSARDLNSYKTEIDKIKY